MRGSRERSSKSTFLSTPSRFPFPPPPPSSSPHPFSPLAFILRVCPLADSYTSHPSLARLSVPSSHPLSSSLLAPCTHISVHLFPSFPSRRHRHPRPAPSRTIRAIRTPLDISIRHLLGSGCSPRAVRERNLRMNLSVKRPVQLLSISGRRRFYPRLCPGAHRSIEFPMHPPFDDIPISPEDNLRGNARQLQKIRCKDT